MLPKEQTQIACQFASFQSSAKQMRWGCVSYSREINRAKMCFSGKLFFEAKDEEAFLKLQRKVCPETVVSMLFRNVEL